MIHSSRRLSKSRVGYVLKKGIRLRFQRKEIIPFFNITYLRSTKDFNRFCVIVSSKVAAEAVQRNQLRRRIYESIREHEKAPLKKDGPQQKSQKQSADIAIIAKAPARNINFQSLKKTVEQVLEEITNAP